MPIGAIIAIVVVVVIVLIIAIIAGTYNSLVRTNERVEEAWSDITVQLKYRADLIPNVVETVKGYAKHEKETFEMVTQARSAAMGAKTAEQFHENVGKWRDSRSRQMSTNVRPVQEHRYQQRPFDPSLDDVPEEQLAAMEQLKK